MSDYLSILQDRLSGVKGNLYCYREGVKEEMEFIERQREENAWGYAPYAVLVWESGLDYDEDGTPYFDDYPEDYPSSFHLSRKKAEVEASYLIAAGIAEDRITIAEGYDVVPWRKHEIPQS